MLSSDQRWYKDAIIYQLHVKCFLDRNNDGIGDFRGLIEKLDYIQDLGVTAVWLLPFYPSPCKDDGYDIAEFTGVHRDYGTLRDAHTFIREAHRRGLRVITELVVNHTSDQHAWFQAARRSPPGSAKREFYVWSDTDQKFPETRIIFTDTETSNWSWDPVAKAYYWHRFFSHQPDLNHNNPKVVKAVMRVMRFWLDAGVDGLRLDAIPYLCVREGTNNENLPETHAVIRQFRALIDAEYPDRMLLAEANQWPEDVRPYFGDDDECHMAFHFPVMPRIFMAVALEDRQPIIEIMSQTPEIPESAQWAIFLRNHDELTLEMVSDRERNAMYKAYAADPKMRRNVGICRRLAPMMENDRRKIEMLNSLLLSFPGTPVIYYGDELGMGDNIYVGDRDGVRTPMQWNDNRNAGFSSVDPAQLYLPVIMDPVYGYQSVNVEALSRCPFSLLNWMKQIIAVRKQHPAFGRGGTRFLQPRNSKILAYLREHEGETLLCVANLSRNPQPVELELSQFNGRTPVELMGSTPFPRIGELPYLLTLAGYGFFWFLLAENSARFEDLQDRPRAPFWVIPERWQSVSNNLQKLQEIIASFLPGQRWFGGKGHEIESMEITHGLLPDQTAKNGWLLCLVQIQLQGWERQTYFLPLALAWDEAAEELAHQNPGCILAKVRQNSRIGVLYDAFFDPDFSKTLIMTIGKDRVLPMGSGQLVFSATTYTRPEMWDPQEARTLSQEQSNTLVVLDDQLILKGYRLIQEGMSPELEFGRYLTEVTRFPNTPPVVGALEYSQPDGAVMTIALLQVFIPNQGDGWSYTINLLEHYLEAQRGHARDAAAGVTTHSSQELAPDEQLTSYLSLIYTLGLRTGQLHTALAQQTGNPAFDPEPITSQDLALWRELIQTDMGRTCDTLADQLPRLDEPTRQQAEQLLSLRKELKQRIEDLMPAAPDGLKTRFHGDFHLGQILVAQHDIQIIDFEGERPRPGQPRRQKHSPLRDLAGILRSISYATDTVLRRISAAHPEEEQLLHKWAKGWEDLTAKAFWEGCQEGAQNCLAYPKDAQVTRNLLDLFVIEKALYEINYELNHRPDWVGIPIRGILGLFEG